MKPKSFDILKALVWEAYEHVKANGGAAGVDHETIEKFEERLRKKCKLWNRMCSGSYFPPPVKAFRFRRRQAAFGCWAFRRWRIE